MDDSNARLKPLSGRWSQRRNIGLNLISIFRFLDSPRCVLVILSLSKPAGERKMQLCGTCLIDDGDDPRHAAIKAVLQATNRLFETDFIFLH